MAKRPVRYDFDIYQGRTLRKTWRYRNPLQPDGTPGDPVDITDWHARLVIPADADEDFVFMTDDADSFPAGAQIIIGLDVDPNTTTTVDVGTFQWYIPDEVTDTLDLPSKADYYFDFQYPNGDWMPYLRGVARFWKVAGS